MMLRWSWLRLATILFCSLVLSESEHHDIACRVASRIACSTLCCTRCTFKFHALHSIFVLIQNLLRLAEYTVHMVFQPSPGKPVVAWSETPHWNSSGSSCEDATTGQQKHLIQTNRVLDYPNHLSAPCSLATSLRPSQAQCWMLHCPMQTRTICTRRCRQWNHSPSTNFLLSGFFC